MQSYEDELAQIVADLNRAAQAPKPEIQASLDQLLIQAAKRGASDVVLIAGAPAAFRVNGLLAPSSGPSLTAEETRNFLLPLLSAPQQKELQTNRYTDLCFTRPAIGRFRANVHYQRGTV